MSEPRRPPSARRRDASQPNVEPLGYPRVQKNEEQTFKAGSPSSYQKTRAKGADLWRKTGTRNRRDGSGPNEMLWGGYVREGCGQGR